MLKQEQVEQKIKQNFNQELFLPVGIKICWINRLVLDNDKKIQKTYVTYKSQNTTIGSIISQYIETNNLSKYIKSKKISFCIRNETEDLKDKTISQIKTLLNNQIVQTLTFQPFIIYQGKKYEQRKEDNYKEWYKLQKQSSDPQNCLQICMKMPELGPSVVIYGQLNCSEYIENEIRRILKENQSICKGVELWNYQKIIKSQINDQNIQPNQLVSALKQHSLIEIRFNGFERYSLQQYNLNATKIKIKLTKKMTVGIFHYQKILNLKVYSVLQLCKIQNPKIYGLRIFQTVIKPYEIISKYDHSSISREKGQIIEAYIIPQIYNFYDFQTLSQKQAITLNQKQIIIQIIKETQQTQKTKVQKQAKYKNLLQRKREKINKIQIETYKNSKFFDPIFCYTSEYLHTKINTFLSNSNFFQLEQQIKLQSRQYHFIFSLINSLLKLPNYDGKVFRGTSVKDNFNNVGEIICYKSFTSTSISEAKARQFGSETIYQIQCLSGKNINNFSYYPNQNEILLLPYTYFKVVSVDRSRSSYRVYLRQISSVKKKNENVLLWVDDNTKEGNQIYRTFTSNYPNMRTELQQILNNEDLTVWLDKFGYCFYGPQMRSKEKRQKLSVITDMKRGKNIQAGVQTIKLIRQYFEEKVDIFIFVGDVQRTVQVLLKHELALSNNLMIGNKLQEVKTFIRERVLKPDELDLNESSCQLI